MLKEYSLGADVALLEGKRGLAKRELPQIITVLVIIVALVSPLIKTNYVAAATIDVEKCRLNTMLASIDVGVDMKVFRADAPNPFYLDCPKRYEYVSNDNLKVDNVNTKLATNNEEKRKQQLEDFMLSEITRCWKSFGAASDTIYSASTGAGASEVKTDETACFSCSEVFFDKDFESVTISKSDFYNYANSKSMLIGDKNYVEFLMGGNAPDEMPADFGAADSITLDKNQQWSTVFTIKKIPMGWFDDKFNWMPFVYRVVPPANGGIIDCYVADEKGNFVKIDSELAYAIGCTSADKPTVKGFVFGKIAKGYYTFFDNRVGWNTGNAVRFPMTVRFIPTSEVFGDGADKCKRLY